MECKAVLSDLGHDRGGDETCFDVRHSAQIDIGVLTGTGLLLVGTGLVLAVKPEPTTGNTTTLP